MFEKSSLLNKHFCLVIIGLLLTLPVLAGSKVYKWVDDDGVTHYDSSPPINQETTVIKPKTGHSEPVVYEQSASAIAAEEAKATAEKEERLTLKDPKRCEAAKSNIKKLENFGRVRVQDENGGFHYLTEEEQQEKIKFAQKVMTEAC